jgi:tRNA G18 (ribose-2'-O)-methylase SpoU
LAVLVGAEGAGLEAETIALADVAVRIPIDRAVDSLNVVVAAGIALHAIRKEFNRF